MKLWTRKFVLATHVTSSVGWIGAIAGFLALAIAGLTSKDIDLVRAAYVAMDLTGWSVVVPLSFASLLTGLVQSLGTPWGLLRHFWVVVKFIITLLATILLLLHMQPTTRLGELAEMGALSGEATRGLQIQLVADATLAIIVLLIATVLAVYKPAGMTRYGAGAQQRASGRQNGGHARSAVPYWVKILSIAVVAMVLVVRFLFSSHGTGHHFGS